VSTAGYIQVRAFTSRGQIPLENVAIAVSSQDGIVLGMRLTDESGLIDPIEVTVPDIQNSQQPNTGLPAYLSVNLGAGLENYESIVIQNLQVFPGTPTVQDLEFIPLAEYPTNYRRTETIVIPSQNL
jgi:hypothetical protein